MSDEPEILVRDGIEAMRDVQENSTEDVALELARLRRENQRLSAALDRDSSRSAEGE